MADGDAAGTAKPASACAAGGGTERGGPQRLYIIIRYAHTRAEALPNQIRVCGKETVRLVVGSKERILGSSKPIRGKSRQTGSYYGNPTVASARDVSSELNPGSSGSGDLKDHDVKCIAGKIPADTDGDY